MIPDNTIRIRTSRKLQKMWRERTDKSRDELAHQGLTDYSNIVIPSVIYHFEQVKKRNERSKKPAGIEAADIVIDALKAAQAVFAEKAKLYAENGSGQDDR